MEALDPAAQHRTVVLVEESPSDVDDASRIDPEKVPVVREVMDRAQRDPVHDGCDAARVPVIDDVRRLEKCCLPEPAHRAPG